MRHTGLLLAALTACTPGSDRPRALVTIHQFGPVGYRDPLGAISPDGRWLATAAHQLLQVRPLPGDTAIDSPVRTLPGGDARVLHLVWRPDGRLLAGQPDGWVMWWQYDVARGTREPLWPRGTMLHDSAGASVNPELLHELAPSMDGRIAGIQLSPGGSALWIVDSLGRSLTRSSRARLGYPVWLPDGRLACLAFEGDRQRVTLPCGEATPPGLDTTQAYGPLAVSPDGGELYFATPNARGFVELHAWNLSNRSGRVLAALERDTYAPSVSRDGRVLYKSQEYHTEVWVMPEAGKPPILRTAFQAETPSWDPTGNWLGITYGTWRRVVDDFRYPDIAQDAGIVAADGPSPAIQPDQVVQNSPSEDQGLSWSPNRRWIVFHSHQQGSDDIWLRPADAPNPLARLSRLGRGAEVGWPRWSPDGRWIAFDGDLDSAGVRTSHLWVVGVDQTTGTVTRPAEPVPLQNFSGSVGHAEWLPKSDAIVFSATESGGKHTLYRVARVGGVPEIIHTYTSTQVVDGFGLSPDGTWLVFPAPDSTGRLQLFRRGMSPGAQPEQLTSDSTEKTQPAVSPDGKRIAYTVWRYAAQFWLLRP